MSTAGAGQGARRPGRWCGHGHQATLFHGESPRLVGWVDYRTCVRVQGAVPPVVPVAAVPSTPAAWTRCWTGCSRWRWPASRPTPWPPGTSYAHARVLAAPAPELPADPLGALEPVLVEAARHTDPARLRAVLADLRAHG